MIGQEISPKEDTFMDEQNSYSDLKEEKIAQEKMPPAGANVDYPSINELEKHVFKQEFKSKDLNSRLASLEKKSLGKTFENDVRFTPKTVVHRYREKGGTPPHG